MTEPTPAGGPNRADRPHSADRPHNSTPRRPGGPGYGRGQDRDARSGRAPRAGRPPSDPARQAAYEAVAAVHRDDAYANLVLAQILREMRLHGRDAAFATELTYGTLRALGTLDLIIAEAAGREVARIDPPARDALRLGAYQLLFTRVPAHAAVNQTVDLVRSVAPGASGFANAVMRGISETSLDDWLTRLAPDYAENPVGNLAVVHNRYQSRVVWLIPLLGVHVLRKSRRALLWGRVAPATGAAHQPRGGRRPRKRFLDAAPRAPQGDIELHGTPLFLCYGLRFSWCQSLAMACSN